MATSLAQLASVERAAGNIDDSRAHYSEAKQIFEEIDDFSRAAQVTIRLAYLDKQAGNLAAAERSTQEVRRIALREGLQEPAIEAMELSGDIALEEADLTRAVAAYRDALDYIETTGFVSRKAGIVSKLAHALMDQHDMEAAAALIGYMIEQGNTTDSLKLRARYAFVQGDFPRSVTLQESAQSLAADDWSEADAETLAHYRQAMAEQAGD